MQTSKTENVYTYRGVPVYWSVDPCSWMYAGYGCQVSISLVPNPSHLERHTLHDKSVAGLPRTGLEAHGFAMVRQWAKAKNIAWLRDIVEERKASAEQARKEYMAEQIAHEAMQDAKYKAKGYTHRVDAWVHSNDGDDSLVTMYSVGEPTQAAINKLLRKSVVKHDYAVKKL